MLKGLPAAIIQVSILCGVSLTQIDGEPPFSALKRPAVTLPQAN